MYKIRLLNKQILRIVFVGLAGVIAGVFISSNDSRKVKDERPLVSYMVLSPEIPSSLSFAGEQIDLTRQHVREAFDRELCAFTYLHATTLLLFKRANRYFPVIEPILKKYGIPDDFKYLAVIESYLDVRVSSPVHAVGMWQFMEATGKEFGLVITPTVDERCHVEKATIAACNYLRKAYGRYGNWVSVAASYNAGMGRITSELSNQAVNNAIDLWLVDETTRYPYRIMAIKQIFENPYRYGFVLKAGILYKPIKTKGMSVSTDINLIAFARQNGITYAELRRLNPWLRSTKLITNGKTHILLLPENMEELYYRRPNTFVHDSRWVVN
ncbi:MAG: lytic transglycosylase domain-containing protein [Tannerellaceae bacterium]|jgi:hypothetical protein|nr:lytic transglycosylase domain-containing protein [Tannerellaceae bacterium]